MRVQSLILALLAAWGCSSVALATSVAPPALPALVGISDTVIVGEVIDIEPGKLELDVPLYKRRGPGKVKFAVAVLKPTEHLLGVPEGETIRIAFVPDDEQPTDGLSLSTPVLKVGEKRLLYLRRFKDPKGQDLLVAHSHFSAGIPGTDEEEATQLTRKMCKLLTNAPESLHSKTDEDRMLTAWALAARYQLPMHVPDNKLEEISAEESRAVLEGLMLMPNHEARHFCHVVSGLGNLTGEFDVPTSTVNGFNVVGIRQWLRDHRDSLRLKRYAGRALPAVKE